MVGPEIVKPPEKRLIAIELTHPDEAGRVIPLLSTLPIFSKIKPSNVEGILHTTLKDLHILIVFSGVSDEQIFDEFLVPLRAMGDTVRSAKQATAEGVEPVLLQLTAVRNEALRRITLKEAIITLELDAEQYEAVMERIKKIKADLKENPQHYHGIKTMNYRGNRRTSHEKSGRKITLRLKGIFDLTSAERLKDSEFNNELVTHASVAHVTPAPNSIESPDTTETDLPSR